MAKTKDNTSVLEESLVEYDEIQKFIASNTEDTLTSIIENTIGRELKNILTEAADDEDEELSDEPVVTDVEDGSEDMIPDSEENDKVSDEEQDGIEVDDDDANLGVDGMDAEITDDAEEEDDLDLDAFKTGDDEYDLTSSDTDTLIKIFKKIGDDDKVIVKKLGDGKIDLIDNENDTEYVIDLNGGSDSDIVDSGENEFSMEEENTEESEEGTLQEDEDPNIEIELDGNEDCVDEKVMTQSIGANRRVGVMNQTRKENAPGKATNRDGAKLITSESKEFDKKVKLIESAYAKKFSELSEDVKQYKKLLEMFKTKFKEQAVLNNNLAKYAKLVTENATSKPEKIEILKRFSTEAVTIEDGNKLFESINKQLQKTDSGIMNVDKKFSAVNEKKQVNESVIYQSNDLDKVKDLMNRMK